MGETTGISWTDHTFNPYRGCTKVSTGCKNCYAETLSKRNSKVLGVWGPQGTRVMASEAMWHEPLKWNAAAKAQGVRRRVFCASLADIFEGPETCSAEGYAVIQAARERLFQVSYDTDWLDWMFLTKRPENIPRFLSEHKHPRYQHSDWWSIITGTQPIGNWWFGTSVENQEAADERIPHLLQVPAVVRFLSCEPLLAAVNLNLSQLEPGAVARYGGNVAIPRRKDLLHLVITGGESGPNARPMHPAWAASLRDQAVGAGIPYHFKQNGEFVSVSEVERPGTHFKFPDGTTVRRTGKHLAGRTLDGRTWDEMPEPFGGR